MIAPILWGILSPWVPAIHDALIEHQTDLQLEEHTD